MDVQSSQELLHGVSEIDDVDVQFATGSFSGHLYIGLCQLVYAVTDELGQAIELAANHPGLTPLMLAAADDDLPAARILLQRGASVGLVNCYGRTALMMAAASGSASIVKLLLSVGAAVDVCDAWGRDAAAWAERRGNAHLVPLLVAAQQKQCKRQQQMMRGHATPKPAYSGGGGGGGGSRDGRGREGGRGREDDVGLGGGYDSDGWEEHGEAEDDSIQAAARDAMAEARRALARAAEAEEAVRSASTARRAAAAAAAAAAHNSAAAQTRVQKAWHGGIHFVSSARGKLSARTPRSAREPRPSARELYNQEAEKPVPPPGSYALDPKAERVQEARRQVDSHRRHSHAGMFAQACGQCHIPAAAPSLLLLCSLLLLHTLCSLRLLLRARCVRCSLRWLL